MAEFIKKKKKKNTRKAVPAETAWARWKLEHSSPKKSRKVKVLQVPERVFE